MRPSPTVIALAAAVLGFVILSAFAAATDKFPGDLWLAERIQDIDSTFFDRTTDVIEDASDYPYVIAIWVAAGLTVAALGGWPSGLLFALAAAIRTPNLILKEIVARPRPPDDLLRVTEYPSNMSYPSGHAATAVILYGLIFYFAAVYVPNAALRIAIQLVSVFMIVVVGVERVYNGGHWPSDVLGGYWFGALIVAVIVILHRYLVRNRMATST